jgi:hypothetical protein
MAFTKPGIRIGPDSMPVKTAVEMTTRRAIAGWLPTIFSAVAVAASCVSVYVSTLQAAHLEVYVPPSIHYARDGGGDTEVFAIPVTIANSGARSIAVVSMELEVVSLKTGASKRYVSLFLGEHPRDAAVTNRQFAPLSVTGRGVFTDTVRFYPAGDALPKLVDDKGDYTLRLSVTTAAPPQPSWLDRLQGRTQPAPVVFDMTLPFLSDQHLNFRRGTIAMHAKDRKSAASK